MVDTLRKAVFLDRDGVINRSLLRAGKPHAPRHMEEFEILPGVETAAKNLADADFLLFVVTNQPDIGNGLVDTAIIEHMHQELMQRLPLTKIYMCPHRQDEGCACRKPRAGMLLEARNEFSIDLKSSFMVGDRYSDVCAAQMAGCTPIFIDYEYVETPDIGATIRAESLLQASQLILESMIHD